MKSKRGWKKQYNSSPVSKKYYFVNGNTKIEARFSKGNGSFACDFEGHPRGIDFMLRHGYILKDEDDNDINENTARDLKREYDNLRQKKPFP